MSKFEESREQLKNKLLEMSSLVERSIDGCIRAVIHKDERAAREVLESEGRVNRIELEIDELAIDLLALHQPMASSLRFLVAALKINTNLERMGDLSVNIAHSAKLLIHAPAAAWIVDIPLIGGRVQSMVRKSIDAFVAGDVDLAISVLASDDEVDRLRTTCYHQLVAFMKNDHPSNIRQGLSLLAVTRTLERIADHSTNIAEDVLFYVKGIDVRHHSPGGHRV